MEGFLINVNINLPFYRKRGILFKTKTEWFLIKLNGSLLTKMGYMFCTNVNAINSYFTRWVDVVIIGTVPQKRNLVSNHFRKRVSFVIADLFAKAFPIRHHSSYSVICLVIKTMVNVCWVNPLPNPKCVHEISRGKQILTTQFRVDFNSKPWVDFRSSRSCTQCSSCKMELKSLFLELISDPVI